MEICTAKLWDNEGGGFFDTDDTLLGVELKGIEDVPHPSVNAVGIIVLLKLYHLTEKEIYYQYSEKALKSFSLKAGKLGIHAGYYFSALDAYFNALKLAVYSAPGSELFKAALSVINPYTNIAHAENKGYVIPCLQGVCTEPVKKPEKLIDFVNNIKYG
jgi:uncharacterized protein YyaL (SSP411 family)